LDSLTKVDLGPSLSQELTRPKFDTDWISAAPDLGSKRVISDDRDNSHVPLGKKKFKKVNGQSLQPVIPLQVWDGKDITRRRRDNNSISIIQSNTVDDWLDSYNSQ